MHYDIIGDVHGQAVKLETLLRKLGYNESHGGWMPPSDHQALFVGDLIDGGPQQMKVVHIVRSMQDAGHARLVMGNHELNAVGFATLRRGCTDEFLRPHSRKNVAQHTEFLRQVGQGSALHRELISWFKSLPPALDLGALRIVHAWWHQPYVDRVVAQLKDGPAMNDDFVQACFGLGSPECEAMEGLTKGRELKLPAGAMFVDRSGIERHEARTKWWLSSPRTYRDVVFADHSQDMPDLPLPEGFVSTPVTGSPIFIGHYWLSGPPTLQASKVACLDYSAARHGPLVAYRWQGEQDLTVEHFVHT